MLEIEGLTRRFGDVTAVDDVSFDVRDGILTGFVGGNGAGKTTTMRMVMGVLGIDAGRVLWQGRPVTAADQRRFGYMPEERGLYPKQRVLDQLVYLARLKGLPDAAARRTAQEHLERFGLAERAEDRLQALSLGNQQRVQIIAALLHGPTALVLDEPFSGLDPSAVDAMADILREHASTGVPVLFSSHQLDLVERLCDRLVILGHGRVVAVGGVDELRAQGPVRYRLALDRDAGWVREVRGLHVVDVEGPVALVEVVEDGAEQALLREAAGRGAVREFTPVRPALADIYREVAAR
ncbi:ABC transporter ATP-binding protein [Phycicoccus endophyticus]|uniref:ABC transporter ATP-binding protein n=1 Tax=Phycicoccus endophyticus TaxID=1690220 RepID=A0A7G9R1A9_9MICO|nr:ATP-binding cassette domain-containing protein [Phycicoccus endophyticus]NHI18839.1 ABC transporter ATP-binding protein [Phycicoccus endophyticus]QNN49384.1 ABC transporter ATP-binding protein [Phycicoccus endophyticus]GGL36129.1 ABC transporter ATP-binding protein [Phycicoccus endophyticus]